jgi:hypothetical protein
MPVFQKILAGLLIGFLACGAAHAGSTVNPTVPAQNSPLSSGPVRSNFAAAYNDINNILGKFAGTSAPSSPTTLQDWVDTSAGATYKFKFWNPTTNTWVQWGSLNIGTGVFSVTATSGSFAATAPVTVSVSGGVATYGLNINSSLTVSGGNLGINLTHSNAFTAVQSVSLNAAALQAAQTGTVLQIGQLDGVTNRVELDSYAAASRFSCVRADNTNALPAALAANDESCSLNMFGYNGAAFVGPQAAVRMYAAAPWTASPVSAGTYLDFATTATADTTRTLTSRMRIENTGGVNFFPAYQSANPGSAAIYSAVASTGLSSGVNNVQQFSIGTPITTSEQFGAGGARLDQAVVGTATIATSTGSAYGVTGFAKSTASALANAIGVGGWGYCAATNCSAWGGAFDIHNASVLGTNNGFDANSIIISEFDVSIHFKPGGIEPTISQLIGIDVAGSGDTAVAQGSAVSIGPLNSNNGTPWTNGYVSRAGAAQVAFLASPLFATGTSVTSQPIVLQGINSGGTPISYQLQGDGAGNLLIQAPINGVIGLGDGNGNYVVANPTIGGAKVKFPALATAGMIVNAAGGNLSSAPLGSGVQTALGNTAGGAGGFALVSGANVASVANSDGTLTISPTTGAVVASLALGHANTWSGVQTFSSAVTSTVTTGTAPFIVASTTNVANLNASSLNGATFGAPGAIGGITQSTGAFTTLSASTSLTSPLRIGGSGTTGTQSTFQTTSGVGTTDQFAFVGGNNGATTFGLWSSTGLGVGSSVAPDGPLTVNKNTAASLAPLAAAGIHLVGTNLGAASFIEIDTYANNPGGVVSRMMGGNQGTTTAISAATPIFNLGAQGYDGSAYATGANILFQSVNAWTGSDHSASFTFNTIPTGSITKVVAATVFASGGFGVGASASDPGINNITAAEYKSATAPTAVSGSAVLIGSASTINSRMKVNLNGTDYWIPVSTSAF